MREYKELRFEDPYRADEELKKAAMDGWKVVCPLSVGYGYLVVKEVEA